MGIFRGTGGTGDSTTDTTVTTVTEKAAEAASSATSAANSATSAANSASSASTSEANAATSETNAANSATASATSATASETAKTAAQAAQTAAETAETNAETAEANAVTAKNQAESARDNAQTAQTAAETAETNAETAYADTLAIFGSTTDVQNAVNSASASATTATTKAAEAATSATNAANSATSAGTSETNAASSASQAATSANTAGSHATDAETAKNAAETAQAAAEAAEANINGLYLGSLANDPTLDGNGVAVTTGDLYFNTTENEVRVYTDNDEWIAVIEAGGDATFNSLTSNNNVVVKGNLEVQGTTITVDSATAQTIDLGDNDKIRLGDSDDLQIYHDGSASWIDDAGTGNLNIRGGGGIFLRSPANETMIEAVGNGKVGLYYDASQKLATTSTGVDITGNITVSGTVDGRDIAADGTTLDAVASTYVDVSGDTLTGDLAFGDNVKAKFGASNDLQIYHDGSHSYISDTGTGNLIIEGAHLLIQTPNAEKILQGLNNGAVSLYYDGVTKLATTSTGVDITGTVVADGIDLAAGSNISSLGGLTLTLDSDNSSSNTYFEINADGTNKSIARFREDGDIFFYEDTGTTAKLTWDASVEELQFKDNVAAEFGDGGDLQIYHDGSNSYINESGTGSLILKGGGTITLKSPADENLIQAVGNGSVFLYYDNAVKLSTQSSGVDVTGTVTADGLTVGGTNQIRFNNGKTAYVTGDPSPYIYRTGTSSGSEPFNLFGNLVLQSRSNAATGVYVVTGITPANRLKIANTGDISFYNDAGTSQDFYWDASTSRLGLGTTSPSSDIHIAKSSSVIRMEDTDNNSYGMIVYNTASGGLLLRSDHNQLTGTSGSNIIFQTDGSEVARFDSNGRLGIGTTSPAYTLDISGSTPTIRIRSSSDNDTSLLDMRTVAAYSNESKSIIKLGSPSTGSVNDNEAKAWHIEASEDESGFPQRGYALKFIQDERIDASTTQEVEAMRLTSDGRLGIGTTSPAEELHITATTPTIRLETSSSSAYYTDFLNYYNSAKAFEIAHGGISFLRASYQGQANVALGTENGARIDLSRSDNTTIFSTNTSEAMRIDSSGNVGIGTTSPTAKLDVEGVVRARSGPTFTDLTYYGIDFYRSFSYLRPDTNGTKTLSIGADSVSKNWQVISHGASNSHIFNIGASEAMRIDSSGSVGIGTTSPSSYNANADNLVISTSANSGLTINSGTASTGNIFFSDGTSGSEPFRGYIQYDHSSDSLRLGASGSEKARIDSSGNLLVGTTANDVGSSSSVEGITLSSGSFGGYISAARSGGTVARLNRQTSDGQILDFRKDGTTVGSIGVDNSDNLVVTGNPSHSGFMIGAETIAPYTGGALRDASEDFGSASYRWRNLYLSGGVYLGGTGSANLLDDYEEGTWTPVLRFGNATTGITYTTQSGNYVKIGNQITVSCEVQLSSKGSATGNATLGGFPVSIGLDAATATIDTVGGWSSLTVGGQTYLVATGTTGFLMSQTASSRSIIQDTQFTNSTHFFFSMTYLIS